MLKANKPQGALSLLSPIAAITPFTLLDYPGHLACILWFSGCNFRCFYCHNRDLLKNKGRLRLEEALAFLDKRKGRLDAMVLSGGEATLYAGLFDFLKEVRAMGGYKIKLDTNGSQPSVIKKLLAAQLLDYLALDYKAPLQKYEAIIETRDMGERVNETLDLLCSQKAVSFEIRTTVHTDFLQEGDIELIMADLIKRGYQGKYYLQNFVLPEQGTLRPVRKQQRKLEIARFIGKKPLCVETRNF